MATGEGQQKEEGKGFAGMSSLVSDVDVMLLSATDTKNSPSADGDSRVKASTVKPGTPLGAPQASQTRPARDSRLLTGDKWILGIVIVFFGLVILTSQSNHSSTPSTPSHTPNKATEAMHMAGSGSKPDSVPMPPQAGSWPVEVMPPVGSKQAFTVAQIHYCLAEKMRIEGARPIVDDAGQSDVDRFNAIVADYNSRCTSYSYRRSDLEAAQQDMVPYQKQLQAEGRSRFPTGSAASAAPTKPQVASRPTEEKPPVGTGLVFTDAQVRYCLAESIRIEGARSIASGWSQPEVDSFNKIVADYNSRCSNFSYHSGALESARREVELSRKELQSEGRSRFASSPSTGSSSTPSSQPPKATVRMIQRKLNELGYQAGPVDGLMGKGTRSAIITFQRDSGLAATGVADEALLLQLQQAPARTPTIPAENHPVGKSVQMSSAEATSLEAACSTDKYVNGPAAYHACVARQKASLAAGARRPDLSTLSSAEEQSIEAACSTDKYVNGPAAYNRCLSIQLTALNRQGDRPDLSRLSAADRSSMEFACSTDKYTNGPAAYNRCLSRQLARLQ